MQDKTIVAPRYYVYELAYPESMGGEVFYVGKGTEHRIDYHEKQARKGYKSHKCDAIREIRSRGLQVVKRKVFETNVQRDAYIYEWALMYMVYSEANLTNALDRSACCYAHLRCIPDFRSARLQSKISFKYLKSKTGISYAAIKRADDGKPVQHIKALALVEVLSEALGQALSIESIENLEVYQ